MFAFTALRSWRTSTFAKLCRSHRTTQSFESSQYTGCHHAYVCTCTCICTSVALLCFFCRHRRRFPPLKPTKRLESLWKTTAKHFAQLSVGEAGIVFHIAERRGGPPMRTFMLDTHAQATLAYVCNQLPAAPSCDVIKRSGVSQDEYAKRQPGWLHLYFDMSEDAIQQMRATVAKQQDAQATSRLAAVEPAAPNLSGHCSTEQTSQQQEEQQQQKQAQHRSNIGGTLLKLRAAKGGGPGSLWRQKEVDRRKGERMLSNDSSRSTPVRIRQHSPTSRLLRTPIDLCMLLPNYVLFCTCALVTFNAMHPQCVRTLCIVDSELGD